MTSIPPLPRTISSRREPRSRSRQRACRGFPTTMRLTLRSRAKAMRASDTLVPERVTVGGAQVLGELERAREGQPLRGGQRPLGRALDVGHDPLGLEPGRHAPGRPHQAIALGVGPHADQDALRHRPGRLDLVVAPVVLHVGVHVLGGAAQGQLAQGQEVAAAEEAAHRLGRPLRQVDLAFVRGARSRSSGGRSTNSTSSAPSSTRSGTVSRTATPVTRFTRSFRLSRCWTFRVV